MISAIRHFLHVFFNVRRIRCEREQRKFGLFDIISFIPEPTIKELYIVTHMDDNCIYAIRWVWYTFEGSFRIIQPEDKEVCIDADMINHIYLVKDSQINRSNLLYYMHQEELIRFVVMMSGAYMTNFPILGIFLANDNHVCIITELEGTVDTGHMTVQDLSASPAFGVLNWDPIQHYCRQRDIIYKKYLRQITISEFAAALRMIRHPVVRADLCKRLIAAINMSLSKVLNYEPIAGGVANLRDNKTNLQPKEGGEPSDKQKQGVKVK